MQYELYMMKKIVALIDNGVVLSSLNAEEIRDFQKIIIERAMGPEETADEIRKLVNFVALK